MQLPVGLRERIRELAGRLPEAELRRASQRLTEGYKREGPAPPLRTEAEQVAYLAVRLPATYGAVRMALEETSLRVTDFHPATMLDLGSGPGTALWAASSVFSSLRHFQAVEREDNLRQLGMELMAAEWPSGETAWSDCDLRTWHPARRYDLAVASYSLGELTDKERADLIPRVWEVVDGAFVLVEPGTRKGFAVVAEAREQFIALGAKLAAPCPHALACPMQSVQDWCHFSARVERSAEHRWMKGGDLGYEDEKFSYVVASRIATRPAGARVVRHPLRHSGHTKLQLCTPQALTERTITRSKKELYRLTKRTDWGSGWEE